METEEHVLSLLEFGDEILIMDEIHLIEIDYSREKSCSSVSYLW